MPDSRRHRGLHPDDLALFAPEQTPKLRSATSDLSWLLGRGYAPAAATKLVGDRYALQQRQRAAMARAACPDARAATRTAHMLAAPELRAATLFIDGFNVLTTLEVALSGGVVLLCRDWVVRDIAGMHGSYRKVEETVPALWCLAQFISTLDLRACRILLDRPVSNSGRLCALIAQHANQHGWPFAAEVVPDPDVELRQVSEVVASADGELLDTCARCFNLAYECLRSQVPEARLIDLSGPAPAS